MAATTGTRRTRRRAPRRRPRTTARAVRSAAARAVERVLASEDAFALLVARLEAAGWRIERTAEPAASGSEEPPPAREPRGHATPRVDSGATRR